jgi:hypothetical protein
MPLFPKLSANGGQVEFWQSRNSQRENPPFSYKTYKMRSILRDLFNNPKPIGFSKIGC